MDDDLKIGCLVLIVIAVVIAIIVGVSVKGKNASAAPRKNEIQQVADVQKNLTNSVPIPKLTSSLERENVAKRAELFNTVDKISYIYLINYGKVMAFYTVKGKVSSLQSYMAPMEKIVDGKGNPCNTYYAEHCLSVSAPDIDGTYGENVEGIFFFTTDGTYVEWKGDYMMSDQPLKLTTQPELVRQIK